MPPKKAAAAVPVKATADAKPQSIKGSTLTAEVIEQVIEHVKVSAPHAEFVYVNSKGEFHLHPRNGFAKVDAVTGDVITEVVRRERAMQVKSYAVSAPAAEPEADDDNDDIEPINDGKEF